MKTALVAMGIVALLFPPYSWKWVAFGLACFLGAALIKLAQRCP